MQLLRGRRDNGKFCCVRHDTLGWLPGLSRLVEQAIDEGWFGLDSCDLVEAGGLDWWMKLAQATMVPPELGRGDWKQHCKTPAKDGT